MLNKLSTEPFHTVNTAVSYGLYEVPVCRWYRFCLTLTAQKGAYLRTSTTLENSMEDISILRGLFKHFDYHIIWSISYGPYITSFRSFPARQNTNFSKRGCYKKGHYRCTRYFTAIEGLNFLYRMKRFCIFTIYNGCSNLTTYDRLFTENRIGLLIH